MSIEKWYEEIYQKCVERFPGREKQIDLLLRLFRNVSFFPQQKNHANQSE
jgi:hypothetical protein